MVKGKNCVSNKLYHLIEQYNDDPYCLEILRFWAEHSCIRFNQKAVIRAFPAKRLHIEQALKRLVEDGVVKADLANNDPLYSLTEDGVVRSLMSELISFDWGQWQSITGKIYPVGTIQ